MPERVSLGARSERDRAVLLEALRPEGAAAAYLLGDLASPFFEHARWWVAAWRDDVVATVLLYTGLRAPVVLSSGAPDGVEAILRDFGAELPAEAYLKVPAAHDAAWSSRYRIVGADRHWIMALDPRRFRRADLAATVRRVEADHPKAELDELYRQYPGNFFEASQLASGLYYGAFDGDRLVSIGGTHVFAPDYGVAVLGNLVTAASARGRGLGAACTSRVVEEALRAGCTLVALQVSGTNAGAIAIYRDLGFRFDSEVLQARGAARATSLVPG